MEESFEAKLRNQLTPFFNLIDLLQFKNKHPNINSIDDLEKIIKQEITTCETNKEEIRKLLTLIENRSTV